MFKVIERSDRILHFRYHRPIIFGCLFIVSGLLILLIIGRTVEFELSRPAPHRVDGHVRTSLYGLLPRERTIRGITGASVEHQRSQKGRSTYRLLLETTAGEEPLTLVSDSDRSGKEQLRRVVERFLASDERGPLREVDPPSFLTLFLGLFCLGAGVQVMMLGGGEVRLDRDADRVELRRRGLLGREEHEFQLSDVREFAVRSNRSGRSRSTTYSVVMRMNDGEEIALRRLRGSGFRKKRELAQLLERFRVCASAERPAPAEPSALGPAATGAPKLCAVCGWDCTHADRVQDAEGREYHKECYEWQQRGGKIVLSATSNKAGGLRR